jgi:hypothetical protein
MPTHPKNRVILNAVKDPCISPLERSSSNISTLQALRILPLPLLALPNQKATT